MGKKSFTGNSFSGDGAMTRQIKTVAKELKEEEQLELSEVDNKAEQPKKTKRKAKEPKQQINVWLPQSVYEDLKNIQYYMPGATLKNLIVEAASNHIDTIKKTHPELLENGEIKSRGEN